MVKGIWEATLYRLVNSYEYCEGTLRLLLQGQVSRIQNLYLRKNGVFPKVKSRY
jgi:hypothetical protein